MKVIWKFALTGIPDRLSLGGIVDMPQGALVRHVDLQDGTVCLWAEVDMDARKVPRAWMIVGTGQEVPEWLSHVGSIVVNRASSSWVLHVLVDNP